MTLMRFLAATLLVGELLAASSHARSQTSPRSTASGFEEWKSPAIALQSGQHLDLDTIAMKISAVETSVILGIIPNFYVVYARDAAPMPASLTFKLVLRAQTDAVTFTGASMLAPPLYDASRPQGAGHAMTAHREIVTDRNKFGGRF